MLSYGSPLKCIMCSFSQKLFSLSLDVQGQPARQDMHVQSACATTKQWPETFLFSDITCNISSYRMN